jgi:hypothetical protein
VQRANYNHGRQEQMQKEQGTYYDGNKASMKERGRKGSQQTSNTKQGKCEHQARLSKDMASKS